MTERSVRRIVIAGGGTAGWIAAAMLARFCEGQFDLVLVESDEIGTVGVGEATIPQIVLLNSMLGFSESEFLRETCGSYKLGIEFLGWGAPADSYMHSFGFVGRSIGLSPFALLWRRLELANRAKPYGTYGFNEVAARLGRMKLGKIGGPSIPNLMHAYHFDAGLYARLLRRYAERQGVTRIEGRIQGVERDGFDGDLTALVMVGNQRIEGDFFIDCTGFRSVLLGQALDVPLIDWSHWLRCDRALAVPCARSDAFRPFTQAIAHSAGWQWRIPLQHRTGNGLVYSSHHLSDDEAAQRLLSSLDGEALDDPRLLRFTTGRRDRFWERNCLAIGLAAGFMEPLESTSIHLIQSAITRLITFFLPSFPIAPAVRDNFNAQSVKEWERIRDFLILHYAANGRVGEPFWDDIRSMPIPDTLAGKIELFRTGGRVTREDDELFTEEAWSQVMMGQGILPQHWSPLADIASDDELADFMESLELAFLNNARQLPTHAQFVRQVSGQARDAH